MRPTATATAPQLVAILGAAGLAMVLGSCRPPCPTCPAAAAPPPPAPATASPAPTATVPPTDGRAKPKLPELAVLPLDDSRLFRAEREALRAELVGELLKRDRALKVLPLPTVDQALRPVSKSGKRCAHERVRHETRARERGWMTTDVTHVAGSRGQSAQLWVQLQRGQGTERTFTAPWNPKLRLVERYWTAFRSLALGAEGTMGLLGSLAATASRKDEVRVGPLSLCESRFFAACKPSTQGLSDRAKPMTTCFQGQDEEHVRLLFEGAGKCEIVGLHAPEGAPGKLEACLCKALSTSKGAAASAGRRTLSLHYEAPDLAGKPRPELRVVEASSNLRARDDWQSRREPTADGKQRYRSVRRLAVDNVDGFAAPLARCAGKPGEIAVADIDVGEAGRIEGARVKIGAKQRAACIEKALRRGALSCTTDGKRAALRIAISWR